MIYESQILIDWAFIWQEVCRIRCAFLALAPVDLTSICGDHVATRLSERLNLQNKDIIHDAIRSAYDLGRRNNHSLLLPYLFNGGLERFCEEFCENGYVAPEVQILIPIARSDGFLPICANWCGKVRARTLLTRQMVFKSLAHAMDAMAVAYTQLKDENLRALAQAVIAEFCSTRLFN